MLICNDCEKTLEEPKTIKVTEDALKQKYCSRCVNSDCNLDCIAKQEFPFDTFICDNGEMFEEYK